jgi:hypothetical protein
MTIAKQAAPSKARAPAGFRVDAMSRWMRLGCVDLRRVAPFCNLDLQIPRLFGFFAWRAATLKLRVKVRFAPGSRLIFDRMRVVGCPSRQLTAW